MNGNERGRVFGTLAALVFVLAVGGRAAALQWTTSYKKAKDQANKSDKAILANFTGSDWCGWCWKLRDEVFKTRAFAKWADANVVLLELDFPRRKRLPRALRAQNAGLMKKYGVSGFPTILILDASGNLLGRSGYIAGGATPWLRHADRILASRRKRPAPRPQSAPESTGGTVEKGLAVFLGYGPKRGRGTIVQLDRGGQTLGSAELPGTPASLVVHKQNLIAALPFPPRIVRIDATGKVKPLLVSPGVVPAPTAVAVSPGTGDIVLGDSESAAVFWMGAEGSNRPTKALDIAGGKKGPLQQMGLAVCADGLVLLGTSEPVGVYRFALTQNASLGKPILRTSAAVAADPTSKRWVAALANELKVFDESGEPLTMPYPAGLKPIRQAAAFAPDGGLFLALLNGDGECQVTHADIKAKAFRTLFTWDKPGVVSFGVGPKMAWK